ncbi:proline-rich extensin-like protein EPR1 [Plectropomus leopardus]|uniref:proline-rich extensin-like protein EPR1 n=1 Tax=Plectropomus leopardus TaxID=160734 RepID=UPI001C4D26EC|nr:proline-rich extensin-like protein EPR1 [Plectropomus leopardus]
MHKMTMRKGKRKSSAVYLAVILACYLAQTIDCYRLRKTERREGRREADVAKTIAFQEGNIVFGRVFEKGSGLEPQTTEGSKNSNASVEDEAAYQADHPGWSKGQAQDATSREAAFKRMAPSLQCGGDQLKFKAVGPGASQFAVEQANAYPMPLSQVPSTCGYSMQRNPLALVMLVPYDGCNIVQEGGSYVLPMRWQGAPVSLWCPKPAAPASTTAAPQTEKKPDAAHPHNPQSFYFPFYPPYPKYPPVQPTAAPTTTTAKKPAVPPYPYYPYYPPIYPFFPKLPVTAAPTTTKPTTTTTTAKPAVVTFPPPMFPFPFYPYPWPIPGPLPVTTKPTTTTTTTKPTTKPPTKPQVPPFPPFMPFLPPPYNFYPPFVPVYPTLKPTTPSTTTTTTPTTTTKKPVQQPPFPYQFPFMQPLPHHHLHHPPHHPPIFFFG